MFDQFHSRLTYLGTLTAQTALRLGAGKSMEVTGTDLPVVRDTLGKPYIPGSSFKGAVRARMEALVRAVAPAGEDSKHWACNPVGKKEEWCLASPETTVNEKTVMLSDEEIERRTCLVCRVFGSHWIAAKVSFRDLLVDESLWFGQFEVRNGVAIDRDTETASDGKLYDFEVVPVGARFRCRIVLENPFDWQIGLLLASLRPFEEGDAALGGARSRGLGLVKLQRESLRIVEREHLLDYLVAGEKAGQALSPERETACLSALKIKLTDREAPDA